MGLVGSGLMGSKLRQRGQKGRERSGKEARHTQKEVPLGGQLRQVLLKSTALSAGRHSSSQRVSARAGVLAPGKQPALCMLCCAMPCHAAMQRLPC